MTVWGHLERQLVLASNSPRRRDLLETLGFPVVVAAPARIDEAAFIDSADLGGSLRNLALAKARSVAPRYPTALVLGGDTIVVCDRQVMGKPGSRAEGGEMLRSLSGRAHEVMSGVAVVCHEKGQSASRTVSTQVWFRKLRTEEIEAYLDVGEFADKAGAYAIQGRAMGFVDRIEGCYWNVVGLPVAVTLALLDEYRR